MKVHTLNLVGSRQGMSDQAWHRENGHLTVRWTVPTVVCECTRGKNVHRGSWSRPVIVPPELRDRAELIFPPKIRRVGPRVLNPSAMSPADFAQWRHVFAIEAAATNGIEADALEKNLRPGMNLCPMIWTPSSPDRPEFVQPLWASQLLARADIAGELTNQRFSGIEFSIPSKDQENSDYRVMHIASESTEDSTVFTCDKCGGKQLSGGFESRAKNHNLGEADLQMLFGTLRIVASERFVQFVRDNRCRGIEFDEIAV